MSEDTRSYHLRRAAMEDFRATEADDPATATAHRKLAALHRKRANTAAVAPTLLLVDRPAG